MILIDIIINDEKIAMDISQHLISKQFALNTHIDTNTIFNSGIKKTSIRLFFITKSLLFDIIDKEIKEHFKNIELLIYSTPVIHISKEFGDNLRLNLKAV
jgi:hypothetical protein